MPIKSRALDLIKGFKAGEPVLNLDRSVAADQLWPMALDKEADKAASILRSFFIDGFIVPYRTLGTCPQPVIRKARGVAVFHVLRAGLHSPSASGSGVIVSRLPSGGWSGASGILVDFDLPQGVDVADIVVVANDEGGLEAMLHSGGMLGKSLRLEAGPIPESSAPAADLRTTTHRQDVAYSYSKSKGELLELDLRLLIIREATAENERFYGVPGVSAREILSGQVRTPSGASDHLYSTINAIDQLSSSLSGLPKAGKCPGDHRVKASATVDT